MHFMINLVDKDLQLKWTAVTNVIFLCGNTNII